MGHKHKVEDTRKRSLLKALTGNGLEVIFDTIIFGIVFVALGMEVSHAVGVGLGLSILTEILCFITNYFNDRAWNRTQFGRKIIELCSGKMGEAEKGYIAGFIDADGNIGIGRRHKINGKYTNYFPRVTLSNSKLKVLNYLYSLVNWNTKIQYNKKHNIGYIHCENREHVIEFLSQIKDYLVLKKDLAEKVLEFCLSRRNEIEQYGKRNAHTTKKELALFEWCKLRNKGKGIVGWGKHDNSGRKVKDVDVSTPPLTEEELKEIYDEMEMWQKASDEDWEEFVKEYDV